MFTEILLLIILIGLNAFFAATEIAFISLNDTKIEKEAKEYWDYEIANDPAERAEQQEQDIYDEPNIEDDFDI